MQVPRPRGGHAVPGFGTFKTSPVILTQALYGNLREFWGPWDDCRGSVPSSEAPGERRASTWEPCRGWALPKPQQQSLRSEHPGEGRRASGSGPGCGHLPPPPARCGRGLDLAPQPYRSAQGRRPPSRPYRGGGHGGSGGHPVPAGGGTQGKKGPGWKGGPCGARNRLPRAAAPPGHYNNGGPVKRRAPGVASRVPRPLRLWRQSGLRRLGGRTSRGQV